MRVTVCRLPKALDLIASPAFIVVKDGVRFLMEDEEGSTVACRVSHEAMRDHAERVHLSGTDATVFEAYRELIEQVASDTYDAEGPVDDHGRIIVTSEALARVTRSA